MSFTASTSISQHGLKAVHSRQYNMLQHGNLICTIGFITCTALITYVNSEVCPTTAYLPLDTRHRQSMSSKIQIKRWK